MGFPLGGDGAELDVGDGDLTGFIKDIVDPGMAPVDVEAPGVDIKPKRDTNYRQLLHTADCLDLNSTAMNDTTRGFQRRKKAS